MLQGGRALKGWWEDKNKRSAKNDTGADDFECVLAYHDEGLDITGVYNAYADEYNTGVLTYRDQDEDDAGVDKDKGKGSTGVLTYRDAGVDIDAGEALVQRIKP